MCCLNCNKNISYLHGASALSQREPIANIIKARSGMYSGVDVYGQILVPIST
jgi:hypothetical protein